MSGPLVLVFGKWWAATTKGGVAGAAGAFGLALLSSACLLLLLGTGSLFGLTAHTWRMINTLAALHIRSACREDVLPVAEHPHTLVPLRVLNYVCFMIYLTHPCKNVERAPFRQYVLSAFVCLAAPPSTHSRQISRGRDRLDGAANHGAPGSQSAAGHAVRRFNRLSPTTRQGESPPTSVIALRRQPVCQFRCATTAFLNHK